MSIVAETLKLTQFPDQQAFEKTTYERDEAWLARLVTNPPHHDTKAECLWLKMAEFGEIRTDKNCLRHDANVISVCGAECDYDAGVMSMGEAAEILRANNIKALFYTSASHTPEFPKWRALLPFSHTHTGTKDEMKANRKQMVARVDKLLGNILANESYTLSQAYYIGQVNDHPYHSIILDGDYVNDRDDLHVNELPGKNVGSGSGNSDFNMEELIDLIYTEENYHNSLIRLAAHFVGTGMKGPDAMVALQGIFQGSPNKGDKWQARFDYIENAVSTAVEKFTPEPGKTLLEMFGAIEPSTHPPDQSGIDLTPPTDMLQPQGILKVAMDYCIGTSRYPQPVFALGAALALVSGFIGHRYRLSDGTYCNLNVINVGPSGSGKEVGRQTIKRAYKDADEKYLIGGDDIGSGAGLEDRLKDNPVMVLTLDEFGKMLQAHASNADSNGVVKMLMRLYSASGSSYTTRLLANTSKQAQVTIDNPFVSLLGTCTPGQLIDAMCSGDSENGWLGRLMIFHCDEARPRFTLPRSMDSEMEKLSNWGSSLMFASNLPTEVPYAADALERVYQLIHENDDWLRGNADNPKSIARIRLIENASKIALIHAVSRQAKDPVVELMDLEWAYQVAMWSATRTAMDLVPHIADSEEHAQILKLIDIVKRAKDYKNKRYVKFTSEGFVPYSMALKLMKMKVKPFLEVYTTCKVTGEIVEMQTVPGQFGRKKQKGLMLPGATLEQLLVEGKITPPDEE